jgi:hypothetical protein
MRVPLPELQPELITAVNLLRLIVDMFLHNRHLVQNPLKVGVKLRELQQLDDSLQKDPRNQREKARVDQRLTRRRVQPLQRQRRLVEKEALFLQIDHMRLAPIQDLLKVVIVLFWRFYLERSHAGKLSGEIERQVESMSSLQVFIALAGAHIQKRDHLSLDEHHSLDLLALREKVVDVVIIGAEIH